jgi:methionine synthase II (cobalamin-independent)
MTDYPWAPGSATGIGSLPGTDPAEATRIVLGELALPHLPELPARGPGADMIGRGAGLLTDLPVELYAGTWRVATHAGLDLRRTRDLLERDLDALTEAADSYRGPLKLQAPGPWTLAASLDLPVGGRLLHDHGAVRDLTDSLTEGLRAHLADVARRMPGATLLLQLDEPSVPAVLAGRVPTESGLRTLRSVAASTVESTLRALIEAVGVPVIMHCCAPRPPLRLFQGAGATAVAVDLTLIGTDVAAQDELGELLDAGLGLFAGAVPTTGRAKPPGADQVTATVTELWKRLGFTLDRLPEQVVVTPACGLAGSTPDYARAALTTAAEAARRLTG